MKPILLTLICSALFLSCKNYEEKSRLEKQNEELQTQLTELNQRLNKIEEEKAELERKKRQEEQLKLIEQNSTTYYFIVLDVQEKNYFDGTKNLYITSKVNRITNYNENIKYELLDAMVQEYKNSINANLDKGRVLDRNIYTFNSYEKASKAREKYIMDHCCPVNFKNRSKING